MTKFINDENGATAITFTDQLYGGADVLIVLK